MPRLSDGPVKWELDRDAEGHREYKLTLQVIADNRFQGPEVILSDTPGLPIAGDFYRMGEDFDEWAYLQPQLHIAPVLSKEPSQVWTLDYTFSTKPPPKNQQRCNDQKIEDPLQEPMKINGAFNKITEEAWVDRFGRPITNSAWEQIRGPQVEFDKTRPTVTIEQNVPILDLPILGQACNTVNAYPWWGLPARRIKISSIKWERKFFGQCFVYYTRTFEFDIQFDDSSQGFDKDILDEGTKVLNGRWKRDQTGQFTGEWELLPVNGQAPSANNPKHFIRMTDPKGNPIRGPLNGKGLPAGVATNSGLLFIALEDNSAQDPTTSPIDIWLLIPDFTVESFPDGLPENRAFTYGYLVEVRGGIYVSILNNNRFSVNQPDAWVALPNGVNFKGTWSGGAYSKGDVVNTLIETNAGSIHVEKYNAFDFAFLGLPVVLEGFNG